MRTEGVIWVGLWVRDVEGIVGFYRDVLGMPELERGAGYVHLDAGGRALLEIFTAPIENREVTGPPQQHSFEIALWVDDLDAAIDELRARDVPLSLRDLGHYRDQRWIRLRDPEGNRLAVKETSRQRIPAKGELVQALRTSAQQALADLRGLSVRDLEEKRDVLSTMAAIEWTLPRIVQLTADGTLVEGRTTTPQGPSLSPDEYLSREVQRRAGLPAAGLLAEFERNRQATLAAVESLDEPVLSATIRSAVTGPLAIALYAIGVEHQLGLVGEITGGDYLSWRLRRSPQA